VEELAYLITHQGSIITLLDDLNLFIGFSYMEI
jgi:hypothetical protein